MRALFDVAAFRARGMSAEAVKRVIEKRFDDGTYGRPQRAGVSYMIAPVQRTYYAGGTFVTVTLAHIMYYAPNVHNADIGGAAPMGPFPFVMDDGPHGYFIQILGEAETAKIVAAEAELLRDLCAYKRELCLAKR
jgi:hypothetical protein